MSSQQVLNILGKPIKDDISEWHYCTTGMFGDEHLVIFFKDDHVITKEASVNLGGPNRSMVSLLNVMPSEGKPGPAKSILVLEFSS